MLHDILVPLDGSPFGEHALPLALSIAQRAGATLHVAHVHEPVTSMYSGGELAADVMVDATYRNHERAYLDRVVKKLAGMTAVPIRPKFLDGAVGTALCEQATREADLVVMTTHGRGPLSRLWLGSIADHLVRHSARPLLLVRPTEDDTDLAREVLLQRILIPLDGSPLAEEILEPAIALGSLMDADYTLARVIKPEAIAGYAMADAPLEEAQSLLWNMRALHEKVRVEAETYLERVAQRLRSRSLRVQTRVITNSQVAIGILHDARVHPVDLVALETHGRGGLARLFLGSVADKVLRGGSTPLLVHRPPSPAPNPERAESDAAKQRPPLLPPGRRLVHS